MAGRSEHTWAWLVPGEKQGQREKRPDLSWTWGDCFLLQPLLKILLAVCLGDLGSGATSLLQ